MKKILLFIVLVETIFIILIAYKFSLLPSFFYADNKISSSTVSQDTPTPTPFNLEKMEIAGWFAAFDSEKARGSLPEPMERFDVFAPMLYRIMSDSSLGRHNVNNRSFMLSLAREQNIPLEPVITDESDPVRVRRLLTNNRVQEAFINDLIEEADDENFRGWGIDIENLSSKEKDAFSEFIKNTYRAFQSSGLRLNVLVYAKKEGETYDPALAHDYRVIGENADQVQLMIYNYNNEFTSPGGQAPLTWYRSVLKYAVENIPREKILVGLATYGYDWTDGEVVGLTYPEVLQMTEENAASVDYNREHSSKVAIFEDESGGKHEVWFEDAETILEKMEIAREEFGINKFAFWRTSAEDPRLWEDIEKLNP